MAVPKKKMTSTRSGNRRNNLVNNRPSMTVCPQCKALIRPHMVCSSCGSYRGTKVTA